jgi:hypothetical protein
MTDHFKGRELAFTGLKSAPHPLHRDETILMMTEHSTLSPTSSLEGLPWIYASIPSLVGRRGILHCELFQLIIFFRSFIPIFRRHPMRRPDCTLSQSRTRISFHAGKTWSAHWIGGLPPDGQMRGRQGRRAHCEEGSRAGISRIRFVFFYLFPLFILAYMLISFRQHWWNPHCC